MTAIEVARHGRWLDVRFAEPHETLSWAIVGGGRRRARSVCWRQVEGRDLRPPVDARQFLERELAERGIDDAVGLLTSCDLDSFTDVERSANGWSVRAVATVGLGNALRAGDPASAAVVGTINVVCAISGRLTEEALVEAVAVVVEARTAAVLEASLPSKRSGLAATGTGTDCVVVASRGDGSRAAYAGKHTVVGQLIGESVGEAVRLGVASWVLRQGAT